MEAVDKKEQFHWLQQLLWTSAFPNEMFLLYLLLDLKMQMKNLFLLLLLFPSPPGDSENSRNHLEAAHFSEAAGSGGHLQDGSFCKRKWQRKGHEDNRDHSFMGRNYDKSLAALARSLFFYGTLTVVSKDSVVNGVRGGKLLFLGYTSHITCWESRFSLSLIQGCDCFVS